MLILYDFKCRDCDEVHEHLVPREQKTKTCPTCQGLSERMISPVRGHCDGTDPGFPGAYDKWARDHVKRGGDSQQTLDERHSKGPG